MAATDLNGKTLLWFLRFVIAAFMTWAIADRIAVGVTLIDLRERVTVLETRVGIDREGP